MTKKRLSDLVKEEFNKPPESDNETTQNSGVEGTDAQINEEGEAVDDSNKESETKPAGKRSTPTKADLEATIQELRDALKISEEQEASLLEQMEKVEADLQEQKKLVSQLQKDLKQLKKVKDELESAKNAATLLAETNEKLTEEVKTLKKENAALKTKSAIAAPIRPRYIQEKPEDKLSFDEKIGWFD